MAKTQNTNPFKGLLTEKSVGQTFDKNIKFTLGGKEQSIYEYTQAARTDTEIYPCLEKYGCIDKCMRPLKDIYGDASALKDLRGTIEDQETANKIWYNIPLEIRNKFNNNKDEFIKNGMKWAEEEMKKQAAEQANKTPVMTKSDTTTSQEN